MERDGRIAMRPYKGRKEGRANTSLPETSSGLGQGFAPTGKCCRGGSRTALCFTVAEVFRPPDRAGTDSAEFILSEAEGLTAGKTCPYKNQNKLNRMAKQPLEG